MSKSYTELCSLSTYKERFDYLKTDSKVGEDTFGHDRWINQDLYHSSEWKRVRSAVIARDLGCDLGLDGYQIRNKRMVTIHHINTITLEDILSHSPKVFDMENLVCVSSMTHKLLHFGTDEIMDPNCLVERYENDTIPWR